MTSCVVLYSRRDITMPRKSREISPTGAYHFINRGVNKKHIFHKAGDYERYMQLVKEYAREFKIEIYHYCLMVNHTHFLLKTEDLSLLSKFGHFVHRRYAYYYCKAYQWPEQVFRRRFVSIPIEDDAHFLECGRYIERNPLEAGLVDDLRNYSFTSYSYYAYNELNPLITSSPVYESLSNQPHERRAAYRLYVTQNRKNESTFATLTCPF